MAQYKNNREAVLGDEVFGENDGKPFKGKLVLIHRLSGKDATTGAVNFKNKLLGDLKLSELLHADDAPQDASDTESKAD